MNYTLNYQKFIPGIFAVLLTIFGFAFFLVQKGSKTISIKFFIIYSVVSALLFAVIAMETYFNSWFDEPATLYIATQFVFLAAGIGHTYALRKLMAIDEKEAFIPELIFTVYIAFLGAAVLTLAFTFLNRAPHSSIGEHAAYGLIFASSIIVILIPFCIYHTFVYFISIPEEEFTKWYYPVGHSYEVDDAMLDDNKVVILEFEVHRKASDPQSESSTRVKIPLRVEFGKIFAIWIDQINDGNDITKIDFCDEFSQPYGWYFYKKPGWYGGIDYIDPELTVAENKLKENDIIIAERIID